VQTLWLDDADVDVRKRRINAAIEALAGIGPKDDLEAILAARPLATPHDIAGGAPAMEMNGGKMASTAMVKPPET
jgi:hypothetical protein